jgi:hypothetical protein
MNQSKDADKMAGKENFLRTRKSLPAFWKEKSGNLMAVNHAS